MLHPPKNSTKGLSYRLIWATGLAILASTPTLADTPAILEQQEPYLPDFSYAGYGFGESEPDIKNARVFDVTDYGAAPNDGKDDSRAILKAMAAAHDTDRPAVVTLPAGRFILSDIIYIERSNLVLRGAGSGATELYFPRPMMYLPDPPALKELREYLVAMEKRQWEKDNNIDLPFSQYSWAGGFIWTRVPGERVKAYLDDYHEPQKVITHTAGGNRGENWLQVADANQLSAGDVVRINWHNRAGEDGPLLEALYNGALHNGAPHTSTSHNSSEVTIGSHHWTQPEQPLVTQQVKITQVQGDQIRIKDTLLHDYDAGGQPAEVAAWPHLHNVGIEHLSLTFPESPTIAHHVEQGYNGIYLTRVFNSWVRDIRIHNADSGVLTDEIANVTLRDVTTTGDNLAHYSVAMGDTHNVLVQNLKVHNQVRHPLSFNTFATRNVYTHSQVFQSPVLDQHSGANHQNLFDDIQVEVSLTEEQREQSRYPLFQGGGAGYWKPTHGAFNTFWNIDVQVDSGFNSEQVLTLHGVTDGPAARLIGVRGNRSLAIEYEPDAYIEGTNQHYPSVPSLYQYQLQQRLERQSP